VFADDAATAPTMTNSHAIHKKIMKECMAKQDSTGVTSSDSQRSCEAKVKEQMKQMNYAGTVPSSSVPQQGAAATDSSQQPHPGSAPQ
jgi:hypothetical protein